VKANAKLNVCVVGHTEAVVKALSSKYGIDAKRMSARGIASLSPGTTNRTDEGRTKNRRIELVEQ